MFLCKINLYCSENRIILAEIRYESVYDITARRKCGFKNEVFAGIRMLEMVL